MGSMNEKSIGGHVHQDDRTPWESGIRSLQSEKERRLLGVIDEMRDFDIHHDNIDLPQLVVCGDQSSGKSSVLEAISKIPFPRGENTCTRFVTEIRFRKSDQTSVTVSIHSQKSRESEQPHLVQFSDQEGFSQLPDLVQTATERMLGSRDSGGGSRFSRDVLRIEIRGPDRQSLTLVDLPGLIVNDTRQGADVALVEEIVREYITNPKSIILAVLDAGQDADNQAIIAKAKKTDPDGRRTFGIVTKPDVPPPHSDSRKAWIDIVQNKREYKFEKGWHTLLNRDFQQVRDKTSPETRDQHERRFFMDPANEWSVISKDNWGVDTLRLRLQKLLYGLARESLPQLLDEITTRLMRMDESLEKLNAGLKTREEMWNIYKDKCNDMCDRVNAGVSGKYNDYFYTPSSLEDAGYLRAEIEKQYERFAGDLALKGHGIKFPNTEGYSPETDPAWVEKVHRMLDKTTGEELKGEVDPQRLTLLFWEHSEPWTDIAREHVRHCFARCESYIDLIIRRHLSQELPLVRSYIWRVKVKDALKKRQENAIKELENIERDRQRPVKTYNTHFLSLSQQVYNQKLYKIVFRAHHEEDSTTPGLELRLAPEVIAKRLQVDTPEKRRRELAEEILSKMLIYYDVARDGFMHSVIHQVMERHLLHQLHRLFGDNMGLSREEFDNIWKDDDYGQREAKRNEVQQLRDSLWDYQGKIQDCLIDHNV